MNTKYNVFMGRLGKDPELRYTRKSEPVCSMSVAVDKENSEAPDWRRVVVWGKQAEQCNLYLKKGHEVFVHGQMKSKEFRDREGQIRSVTEWNARLVGFSSI